MRKSFLVLALVAIAGLSVATQSSVSVLTAQDATGEKPTDTEKKSRGRLPAYYAQVGLNGVQRDKIYEVQASYSAQIEVLQKQIAALETKRDGEVEAVLTPEQKKAVDDLVAAAKKRAEERRKKE